MEWESFRNVRHYSLNDVSYVDIFVKPNAIAFLETGLVVAETSESGGISGTTGLTVSIPIALFGLILGIPLIWIISGIAVFVFGFIELFSRNKESKKSLSNSEIEKLLKKHSAQKYDNIETEFKNRVTKTTIKIGDKKLVVKKGIGKQLQEKFNSQ